MSALINVSMKQPDGSYKNYTISINDESKAFGKGFQNVTMWEAQTKEQREAKEPKKYSGNGSVIWTNGTIVKAGPAETSPTQSDTEKNDDLPF